MEILGIVRPYNHYNSLSYKELASNTATIQANKNRYFMINGDTGVNGHSL